MRYPVRSKRLGWIFGLVVLVPGILLAVIAIRTINREEAYIEKQLEGILLAEVVYLVSLAEMELGRIEKDLDDSAPLDPVRVDPGRRDSGFEGGTGLGVAGPAEDGLRGQRVARAENPLTSIRMFAEMLKTGRQQSEGKRLEYLSLMVLESERLTRLINNVLDFCRVEQGRKRYTKERGSGFARRRWRRIGLK